jgi:uncharacterized protein YndB with AHSA1/START domain
MTQPGHALRVERLFDVPRETVFEAWIAADQLAEWFHYNDEWQIVEAESDARVGGRYRVSWKAPDGQLWHESGEYLEITPPEKLVMTCQFDFPDFEEGETLLTVEFLRRGDQTLLVLVQEGYRKATNRDNHQQGWPGFLDQLSAHLAT